MYELYYSLKYTNDERSHVIQYRVFKKNTINFLDNFFNYTSIIY